MASASTVFPAISAWDVTARYTAGAAVDVLISNTGTDIGYFEITDDDTPPAFDIELGHPVEERESRAMQLKTGDRLWMAGRTTFTLGVLVP